MGIRILFLARASHLCFGYPTKQLSDWWYWGGEYWVGMGMFEEAFGHNFH
jgi:hypothetical protein